MTDRATPDRAAAPAPLAERLRELAHQAMEEDTKRNHLLVSMTVIDNLPTLLAALDGREAGWLPIESAPRDGTKVDLWITPPSGQLTGGGYGREPDCWFSNGKWWRHDEAYGDDDGCRKVRNATHWRSLPAPPARPQPAGEVGDV